jgi:elongation factor P hydroxylase
MEEFNASFEFPWYEPNGRSTTTKARFTALTTDEA